MPSQTHSTLDSGHSTRPSDDEVLVRVEGVSKKFCRSLKKSLWYGVCDIASELNPFGRTAAFSNSHKNLTTDGSDGHGYGTAVRNQRADSAEFLEGHSQAGLQMDSEKLASIRSANAASGSLENSSSVLISEISGKKSSSALDSGPSPLDSTHGLRAGEFFAVKDVSFELRRGECLGLIGHNGAGKTTLLKMLNGLIKPDAGSITMRGRVGALIALGAGFNPILTGRENIYINGSVLGLTKKEIDAKIDEIIDFADVREAIDMPVQNYSSGMNVRLGFAVATTLEPDILILDEVLAVGDAKFRNKCYNKIGKLHMQAATIFVSHSMDQIAQVCDKVLVMHHGRPVHCGDLAEGISLYESLNAAGDEGETHAFETIEPPVTSVAIRLGSSKVPSGGSTQFEMEVDTQESLPNVCLRIVLYDQTGVPFAEWNNRRQGLKIALPSGRSKVHVNLGPLALKSGIYRLGVNLNNETGLSMLCWSFKKHALEIEGVVNVGPNMAFQSECAVLKL